MSQLFNGDPVHDYLVTLDLSLFYLELDDLCALLFSLDTKGPTE